MMRSNVMYILVIFFLAIACKKEVTPQPGDMKVVPLTPVQKSVITRSNAFGFDFFRTLSLISDSSTNMMVSPLSVSMALGMTRNGAAGATLDSMTQTLGFGGFTETEINESYQYILKTFSSLDPKVKLAIANSIWYRNTFTVEQPFIDINRKYFSAEVAAVDFSSPDAVTAINNWVSSNTNNLIPRIVENIPDLMVMYLINAVYFKGSWRYRFDESMTEPRPFWPAGASMTEVPTMIQKEDLQYLDGDGFQAVELPYNQGNFTMTILLPDQGSSPGALIRRLTRENWETWSTNFIQAEVILSLPKFRYEYEENGMIEALTKMGMGVAFDEQRADFTRINRNGNLFISEIKHKTFIETNEEGTEAAAVTSVGVGITSAGPNGPVYFVVDRPFVYFISEKSTGTMLFMGTVRRP